MKHGISEVGKYPCECGRAYSTPQRFVEHVHTDCKAGIITVGNKAVKPVVH